MSTPTTAQLLTLANGNQESADAFDIDARVVQRRSEESAEEIPFGTLEVFIDR